MKPNFIEVVNLIHKCPSCRETVSITHKHYDFLNSRYLCEAMNWFNPHTMGHFTPRRMSALQSTMQTQQTKSVRPKRTTLTIKAVGPSGTGKTTTLQKLAVTLSKLGWTIERLDESKHSLSASRTGDFAKTLPASATNEMGK